VLITRRILRNEKSEEGTKKQREKKLPTPVVGGAGGLLDAIGGGGWGPLVTSTLLARGDHPRKTIGTASISEFLLTVSISVPLILGGAVAAPFAGLLSKWLKPRTLMIMVACVVSILCVFNLVRLGMAVAK